MSKLIMLRGLPASGKTTRARDQVNRHTNKKRISMDDLRDMINDDVFNKENEKHILDMRNAMVSSSLSEGYDVIVDATNLNPIHEEKLKEISNHHSSEFKIKDFDVSLEECIERDKKREKSVGEKVIRDMYNKWIKPQKEEEGFTSIDIDPDKRNCIIVDIDGTIARKGKRDIYDFSKIHLDRVIEPVKVLVNTFSEYIDVIFLSGRDDSCRKETEKRLNDNLIGWHHLYMRKAGDNRKDVIVKKEIYEEHIAPHFNVLFAVDDRKQTVDGRRDLGIFTFDVNQSRTEF